MTAALVRAAQARSLLLGGQGLLDDPHRPATLLNLRRLIEQLGFVQVDSINTVARAHHLILRSRLARYQPAQLERLIEKERFLFEHWTHDASVIPTSLYPYWRVRFRRAEERFRSNAWLQARLGDNHPAVLKEVRRHLRRHGEVRSEDFVAERDAESKGWWSWSPHKAALELMWRRGELAIARRVHFQKVYAPSESVLPEAHALPAPNDDEHLEWACRTALDRLGFATPRELAGYWAAVPLVEARRWVASAAKLGRIVPVQVKAEGKLAAKAAWAWPDWEQRVKSQPEPSAELRILCPFDPILRDRARALRLFDFDYRFEAFTPAAQRRYGYYVLPLLEGDRLVGRLDPQLHRDRGVLAVRRVFWEPGFGTSRARQAKLKVALQDLATWLGATQVESP